MATQDIVGKEEMLKIQNSIDGNSIVIDEIIDSLVSRYCSELDAYISELREIVSNKRNPPTIANLEHFILNLPVLIYFTGDAMEGLGVREDMSKAVKMEIYNKIYESARSTVGDKKAAAELGSQAEFLAHMAYQRAYKKVKFRIDCGNELLQSVKKVLSSRMTEMEMSRYSRN